MAIAELLKDYEESKEQPTNKLPEEFKEIRTVFEEAKNTGTQVLLESKALNLPHSVVLTLDYVGLRWAKGYVHHHRIDGDEYVPYTIHYSDILVGGGSSKVAKVVFKGENPFTKGED